MITIAQISDTHIAGASSGRLRDLARAVAAINALDPPPAAVLHTGDVAHDGREPEYAAAVEVLARLRSPLFAIPGNRDRRGPFRAAFANAGNLDDAPLFIQYAADLGPLRLIALDTLDDESGLGAFCHARLRECERLLAKDMAKPTLVLLHHPPVPIPSLPRQPLQFRDVGEAGRLRAMLEGCQSIVGVVAGHVHRSDAVPLGRAMLTTMPSIAIDLRRERTPYGYTQRLIFHLHRFDGHALRTASVVVD